MLGVLGKSIQAPYPDTDHIKEERIATDGTTQIGDRKMKKMIFAIAMSAGLAASVSAQNSMYSQTDSFGNTYGYDNKGNSFNSHTDSFGNTSGQDNRGNSFNSHTDSFGNTYGQDSRGNSFNSHTDSFGNTYGNDSRGNSWTCHTDTFGNTSCN